MNSEEQGTLYTVYCPYCDRPYDGASKTAAADKAKSHVNGQHPEMPNPFEQPPDEI